MFPTLPVTKIYLFDALAFRQLSMPYIGASEAVINTPALEAISNKQC